MAFMVSESISWKPHFRTGSAATPCTLRVRIEAIGLGHFQLGSYRYRRILEGLYSL